MTSSEQISMAEQESLIRDLTEDPVFSYFQMVSRIPRGSGREAALAEALLKWAEEQGFQAEKDAVGNVRVRKPAPSGDSRKPTVMLQAHMDMVCVKAEGSTHDFTRDPIRWVIKGDELGTGRETTLGADNGIGVALAMAALTADTEGLPHLEALFTVCEEEDLSGAQNFDMGSSSARFLINLDHTCGQEILIGSGGGMRADFRLALEKKPVPEHYRALRLGVHGLSGGHSGDDIDKGRCNAIVVLAKILAALQDSAELMLLKLVGGSFRLAIPCEAEAVIGIAGSDVPRIREAAERHFAEIREREGSNDPGMRFVTEELPEAEAEGFESGKPVFALTHFPNGVVSMREDYPDIPAASLNLGELHLTDGELHLTDGELHLTDGELHLTDGELHLTDGEPHLTDGELHLTAEIRAGKNSLREAIFRDIQTLAEELGGRAECSEAYPPWEGTARSALVEIWRRQLTDSYGEEPRILPIHAGLEVGSLLAGTEGIEAVSVGPDLKMLHSIDETLSISSVRHFYGDLLGVLAALGDDQIKL